MMHLFFSVFSQSVVARYDFNSNPNDANTATGILTPTIGSSSIVILGGISQTFVSGNSNDLNITDNSGMQTTGYPAQSTLSETAGIQINVDALGKNNLVLDFWQRLSNSASNTWKLQYTTDNSGISTGGTVMWFTATTFTFVPQATGTGDTWYNRIYNFSAITALNNNPNVGFRVVSAFDPTAGQYVAARSTSAYSTSGTARFDLVNVFEAPANVSIASASNFQTANENAGQIQVPMTISNANNAVCKVVLGLSTYSDANIDSDFTYAIDTLTIPAASNGVFNFPINIIDDSEAERAEKIIVKIVSGINISIPTTNNYQIIYIKDNDYTTPTPTNELNMNLLTSFSNGAAGTNSAEIVAYDSTNFRLYIANSIGRKLDIVDFSNPSAPLILNSISVIPYGNINSVTAHNGIVAMAIENIDPQTNGFIVFIDADGNFISQVTVGAMPDMITFNKDYTKILTANEGEPNATYTADPEGSISVVDLTGGIASLTDLNVTNIGFTDYNSQAASLIAQGIRIFSTSASVAQDLEPEYITISTDNTKAFVAIQENNAMAVIDLATATIDTIYALGYSDYSSGNGMDASDQSGSVLIGTAPVKGAYMPDAIAYSTINGQGYVFSANEGDSREFGSVTDAARISTLTLDSTAFPDQNILKNNKFIGRLSGLRYSGDTDNDGDLDVIHTMGGRSFSIWNASTGQLVFDSKDLIEQITSTHPLTSTFFNASNTTGAATLKNRSDDKGPEPEGVATAFIDGSSYLFVSLERVGGVMTFNVNDPANPVYVGYYNNRTSAGNGPDLGAEGIIRISADASPNGNEIVILANEVSSTLSIYQINTCAQLSGAELVASNDTICAGETTVLSFQPTTGTTFDWIKNNAIIPNQSNNTLDVTEQGNYNLYVENSTYACVDSSNTISIVVNNLPIVSAIASDSTICVGQSITFNGQGAASYAWDNNVTDGTSISPNADGTYSVIGTDANGCTNTDDVSIVVNNLPIVSAAASDSIICVGQSITFNGQGAATYAWDNNVTDGTAISPIADGTYAVTGTDANGCTNTDDVSIVVNNLPIVSAIASDSTICIGQSITFNGQGAETYAWDNNVTDGTAISPNADGTYAVTGTDANGCTNTDDVSIVVNNLPTVSAVASDSIICVGQSITFNGQGAASYAWDNNVTDGTAISPNADGTFSVTGTDANGCTNTDDVSIFVNNLPTVSAVASDSTICVGQSITFNGQGAATYAWNNNVTDGTAISPNADGTYSVTGTDANGCTNSDDVSIVVNNLPTVDLGADITTCDYEAPVTLNAGSHTSYLWNNNATTATISVTASGTYSVSVSNVAGCSNTDEVIVTLQDCAGIEETQIFANIYPNPTSGIVNIELSLILNNAKIQLVDLQGKILFTNSEFNGQNLMLDLNSLTAGMYLLQIEQNNQISQFRLIKE